MSAPDDRSSLIIGSLCGAAAAFFYTAANVALRGSVGIDPFLVSAVKAVPTVLFLAPIAIVMRAKKKKLATSYAMLPYFLVVALIGQFVGNAAFQVALGVIGLAASVPITLGVLIIGGAVLGRLILHEPVGPRTIVAMITLIAAVVVLSSPRSSDRPAESISQLPSWMGAACAAASGAAYALFGTTMRLTMKSGVSAVVTMLSSGTIGMLALCSFSLWRLGGETILATTSAGDWTIMGIAGLLNFTAFVTLSYALKMIPVVAVNLINASQVAMAAVAGVLLFSEPVTPTMLTGIGLTFAGLLVLTRRKG